MAHYIKGVKDADGEPFYILYEHGELANPDKCFTEPEMDHLMAQYLKEKEELHNG